jgi:TetR/AcrR family fatty acid metabolism transcriptional regulator
MRIKEGNKEKDILESAIKIFAKQGFHETKISQIAKGANVATGSVYLYFKNKDSILIKIFEELWQGIYLETKSLSKRNDISPLEKFETMIDIIFDMFLANPSLAVVIVSEEHYLTRGKKTNFTKFYESFLDLGEDILKEGIKAKQFNPNLDLKVFRNFVFGGIRHLIHLWAQAPNEFPLTVIRQHVKYILKKSILDT